MRRKIKEKFKEVLLNVLIGILALFLTGFVFYSLDILTLKSYYENVQSIMLPSFMFISFLSLLNYAFKRKWVKGLLAFLFPFLIYMLINFLLETILYSFETLEVEEKLTEEEFSLRGIIISIGDLKIILSVIAITFWCWVWLKVRQS